MPKRKVTTIRKRKKPKKAVPAANIKKPETISGKKQWKAFRKQMFEELLRKESEWLTKPKTKPPSESIREKIGILLKGFGGELPAKERELCLRLFAEYIGQDPATSISMILASFKEKKPNITRLESILSSFERKHFFSLFKNLYKYQESKRTQRMFFATIAEDKAVIETFMRHVVRAGAVHEMCRLLKSNAAIFSFGRALGHDIEKFIEPLSGMRQFEYFVKWLATPIKMEKREGTIEDMRPIGPFVNGLGKNTEYLAQSLIESGTFIQFFELLDKQSINVFANTLGPKIFYLNEVMVRFPKYTERNLKKYAYAIFPNLKEFYYGLKYCKSGKHAIKQFRGGLMVTSRDDLIKFKEFLSILAVNKIDDRSKRHEYQRLIEGLCG